MCPRSTLGRARPPMHRAPGALSRGGGHEADHLYASRLEVTNLNSPQYVFMHSCVTKWESAYSWKILGLWSIMIETKAVETCLAKWGKFNPVACCGGPYSCEASKLLHVLDNSLTDGGVVVSFTHPLATPYPQEDPWYSNPNPRAIVRQK
jgi:hypothetical protein